MAQFGSDTGGTRTHFGRCLTVPPVHSNTCWVRRIAGTLDCTPNVAGAGVVANQEAEGGGGGAPILLHRTSAVTCFHVHVAGVNTQGAEKGARRSMGLGVGSALDYREQMKGAVIHM